MQQELTFDERVRLARLEIGNGNQYRGVSLLRMKGILCTLEDGLRNNTNDCFLAFAMLQDACIEMDKEIAVYESMKESIQ